MKKITDSLFDDKVLSAGQMEKIIGGEAKESTIMVSKGNTTHDSSNHPDSDNDDSDSD